MATDDLTTNRVHFASAGAIRRTFSQPVRLSPVQVAHVNLIGALSFQKPHNIFASADHHDVMDRADHLKAVLGAVAAYVDAVAEDTVDSIPLGTGGIDRTEIANFISDTTSDIVGQFHHAVDAMIEARDAA